MRLATEVEESEAKSNDARLRDNAAAWSCNHCSDFLDLSTARSKAAVLSHLQTEYDFVVQVPSRKRQPAY